MVHFNSIIQLSEIRHENREKKPVKIQRQEKVLCEKASNLPVAEHWVIRWQE